MASHKKDDPVIVSTSNLSRTRGRVDLDKGDFDTIIEQKGYDVYIDRAVKCPCRNVPDSQAQSSCKNCGGSGWVFFNRQASRMVVQGMGANTKYQEWSEIEAGTAKITAFNEIQLAFMDRITLTNGSSTHNQVVFCITHDSKIKAKLTYDPIEITEIFLFEGTGVKLKFLVHETDFTVNDNIITLDDTYIGVHTTNDPLTLSVRYTHNPTYHIIDIPRDTMSSTVSQGGVETNQRMPVHAIARKSHYVLDEKNYGVSWLLNNDYVQQCSVWESASDIITIIRKTINVSDTNQTLEELLSSGAFLTIVTEDTAIQTLINLYTVSQVDDTTSDVVIYVGKLKSDYLTSGKWLIERITLAPSGQEDVIIIEYINGSVIEDYATNWTNRVGLAYIEQTALTNL